MLNTNKIENFDLEILAAIHVIPREEATSPTACIIVSWYLSLIPRLSLAPNILPMVIVPTFTNVPIILSS